MYSSASADDTLLASLSRLPSTSAMGESQPTSARSSTRSLALLFDQPTPTPMPMQPSLAVDSHGLSSVPLNLHGSNTPSALTGASAASLPDVGASPRPVQPVAPSPPLHPPLHSPANRASSALSSRRRRALSHSSDALFHTRRASCARCFRTLILPAAKAASQGESEEKSANASASSSNTASQQRSIVLCRGCAPSAASFVSSAPLSSAAASATPTAAAALAATAASRSRASSTPQAALAAYAASVSAKPLRRLSQPLSARQARSKHNSNFVSTAPSDQAALPLPSIHASLPALPPTPPSVLSPSAAASSLSSLLHSHLDRRSLCVALLECERQSLTRAVELQLLQRRLERERADAERERQRADGLQRQVLQMQSQLRAMGRTQIEAPLPEPPSVAEPPAPDPPAAPSIDALVVAEHARLHAEYAQLQTVFASLRAELLDLQAAHQANVEAQQRNESSPRAELEDIRRQLAHSRQRQEEMQRQAQQSREEAQQLRPQLAALQPQNAVALPPPSSALVDMSSTIQK